MSGVSNGGVVPRERLIEALIVAKCARWTMGTCPTRPDDGRDPCEVCAILEELGYEPYRVSEGGLESWRLRV